MFLTFVKNIKFRKEISTLITSFIVLICLYITFVSVLHKQFLFPFVPENNKINKTELNKQQINNSSSFEEIKNNFLSIFFLWASALIAGKVAYYARMPPLLGN
uniref:Uncharacterized protein n=2 Tax=Meloidogyne TaxID=189290 RepID=A0A6V7XP20_MELEN|nr:unnamed protein product [Meloidogyne enterolobii]